MTLNQYNKKIESIKTLWDSNNKCISEETDPDARRSMRDMASRMYDHICELTWERDKLNKVSHL